MRRHSITGVDNMHGWDPRTTHAILTLAGFVLGAFSPTRDVCAQERSGRHADPSVVEGVRGVLDAFRDHRIVGISEVHRSEREHVFLRRLVSAPGFESRVDDIVIEFGNMRYQPLLDRYLAGDDVPRDSLRLVWRNTTGMLVWDSPLYEQLLVAIREANAGRTKKVRVLAGDPPID